MKRFLPLHVRRWPSGLLIGLVWLGFPGGANSPALAAEESNPSTPWNNTEDYPPPDHGSCTYFGSLSEGHLNYGTGTDLSAMQQRTWQTAKAMSFIPLSSSRQQLITRAQALTISSGACSGIDDCISKTAQAAGVPLTYLTTDQEFLRRVRLDLTGRIPSSQEVIEFLADNSLDKREQLVDRLLDSPEWVANWALYFGDHFRNTRITAQVNRYADSRDSLHMFFVESLKQNKSYNQMAGEMISSQGTSDGRTYPSQYSSYSQFQQVYGNRVTNPVRPSGVSYIVGGRTTGGPVQDTYDALAFITSRDFLGISLMECILCHDGQGHLDALSIWGANAKRLEGWQLASYFSDIPRYQTWKIPARLLPLNPQTGRRVRANYYTINDLAKGVVQRTGGGDTAGEYLAQTSGGNRPDRLHQSQYVSPAYPFQSTAQVNTSLRLREQLADHLTSDPQFSRAAVNYIWKQFFSRGIVEPADQFDLARQDPGQPPPAPWTVQPSHPELLTWLAQGFVDNGYNLKWLMRTITTSQTYQLSSRYEGIFNPLFEKYFVRHQVKRLTAEQVYDAVHLAGGLAYSYWISNTYRNLKFATDFPDVVGVPPGSSSFHENIRMFLQSFTPGDRAETLRSSDNSPLQLLNLMNNPFVMAQINPKIGQGTLWDSLEMPEDALVRNLYLNVLGRHPTAEESSFATNYLKSGERADRASNLMWALFNRTDFYFNY